MKHLILFSIFLSTFLNSGDGFISCKVTEKSAFRNGQSSESNVNLGDALEQQGYYKYSVQGHAGELRYKLDLQIKTDGRGIRINLRELDPPFASSKVSGEGVSKLTTYIQNEKHHRLDSVTVSCGGVELVDPWGE